jgi:hypothetical protein
LRFFCIAALSPSNRAASVDHAAVHMQRRADRIPLSMG